MSSTPITTSSFTVHQRVLRERLDVLLVSLPESLRDDVKKALSAESKLLHASQNRLPSGVWALLVFLLAHALAPDLGQEVSSSVALALECYVCAIDVLDDVMDEDDSPTVRALGVPRALSTADALRSLAVAAVLSLPPSHTPLMVMLLDQFIAASYVVAAGQTEDILNEQVPATSLTLDSCIATAARKAGSIMQLACRCAALATCASSTDVEELAQMGLELGIAHQLDNDADDLYHLLYPKPGQPVSGKSDLKRGKKTLPVVLATHTHAISRRSDAITDQEYYDGIVQTWGMGLLYKDRAGAHFDRLEGKLQPEYSTILRHLLDLEAGPRTY